MMRLGFVGVGKHAQKMAAAFRECGAEVVANDRKSGVAPTEEVFASPWQPPYLPVGTKSFMMQPWRAQIDNPGVDALIICAPPEVTTEVALACAKAGKRCVATKPLIVSNWASARGESELIYDGTRRDVREGHRVYVDLWRLYSPAWQALKAELRGKHIERIRIEFCGKGPERAFSGLLDYAPHALAFLFDIIGDRELFGADQTGRKADAKFKGVGSGQWEMEAFAKLGVSERLSTIRVVAGNGYEEATMRAAVTARAGSEPGRRFFSWEEAAGAQEFRASYDPNYEPGLPTIYPPPRPPAPVLISNDRSLALHAFCRAFLAGEPSDTLRLSCEAMKVLMPLYAASTAKPLHYQASHKAPVALPQAKPAAPTPESRACCPSRRSACRV